MGLFQKPLTPEELAQKERYEASKVRLMDIHRTASIIFYIDEVTRDSKSNRLVLIGDVGKGQLHTDTPMDIYSCEGLPVGTMIVDTTDVHTEKHYISGETTRTLCYPKEFWEGYIPGQILVQFPSAEGIPNQS